MSKSIIVNFLRQNHYCDKFSKYFYPRTVFEDTSSVAEIKKLIKYFNGQLMNLDDFIAEIEPEGLRLPVLIRQYLKQNAKFLGFNRDPNFSDCLDGLILLEIEKLPQETKNMIYRGM